MRKHLHILVEKQTCLPRRNLLHLQGNHLCYNQESSPTAVPWMPLHLPHVSPWHLFFFLHLQFSSSRTPLACKHTCKIRHDKMYLSSNVFIRCFLLKQCACETAPPPRHTHQLPSVGSILRQFMRIFFFIPSNSFHQGHHWPLYCQTLGLHQCQFIQNILNNNSSQPSSFPGRLSQNLRGCEKVP